MKNYQEILNMTYHSESEFTVLEDLCENLQLQEMTMENILSELFGLDRDQANCLCFALRQADYCQIGEGILGMHEIREDFTFLSESVATNLLDSYTGEDEQDAIRSLAEGNNYILNAFAKEHPGIDPCKNQELFWEFLTTEPSQGYKGTLVDETGDDGIRRLLGTLQDVADFLGKELVSDEDTVLPFPGICFAPAEDYENFSSLQAIEPAQNGWYGAKAIDTGFDAEDQHVLFSYYGNGPIYATNLYDGMTSKDVADDMLKGFVEALAFESDVMDKIFFFQYHCAEESQDDETPKIQSVEEQEAAYVAELMAGKPLTEDEAKETLKILEKLCGRNLGDFTPDGVEKAVKDFDLLWCLFKGVPELVESEVEQDGLANTIRGQLYQFSEIYENIQEQLESSSHPRIFALESGRILQYCG